MKRAARWGAFALRLAFRLFPATPRELSFEGGSIRPMSMRIPTRHGLVNCDVYRSGKPGQEAPAPPVYVNFHGGAFIVQCPRQDAHACRYIAATTGAAVVNVDYATAPDVQYPVAEEQAVDVVTWIRQNGSEYAWNAAEIAVGGFSAGAKLAVNVCQQLRDAGSPMPHGLVVCYPALNMSLPPTARAALLAKSRTRPVQDSAVAPWLIRLMYDSYFADAARRYEVLASPELDSALGSFPPTLVITGGLDVMSAEATRFAARLAEQGVHVCHRHFENSDHGLTHNLPADVARDALELMAEHVIQTSSARNESKRTCPLIAHHT